MANYTSGLGQSFQVCVTPQTADLSAAQFAALAYIDVCCLQDTVELSYEANVISETCISGEPIRLVGADGDTDLEVTWFSSDSCAGQKTLRDFGLAKSNATYAIRKVLANGTATTTPTTVYARAMFSGYTHSGVGADDVQTESVAGSLVQKPIVVMPAPI